MAMLNNQRVYTSTSRIRHGFGMGIIWGWVVSKPVIAIAAMPWWDEHHPPTLNTPQPVSRFRGFEVHFSDPLDFLAPKKSTVAV